MAMTISEITHLWDKTLLRIEERLGEKQVFDSFFAGSYIYDINGLEITVVVNSALAVKLISSKYQDIVNEVVNELTDDTYEVVFVEEREVVKKPAKEVVEEKKKPTYFKDAALNKKLTFDNFVVGDFNREASQAALFVASNPGKTFAQPLFLYSESGLGKTHLLHSIGNYIQKEVKHNANILYISTSDFVDEYIEFAKGEVQTESLKKFFDSIDVLLLDDIQLIARKDKTQEMLFTIYNKLIENDKQIVITSDKQPSELSGLEDRLVTRFAKGLTVKIGEPDQETCVQILKKKISANGLDLDNIDENVLYFLAEKYSKDIRELEGALNRLTWHVMSNVKDGRVTMDVVLDAISSLVGGKTIATQMNEQKIINVVSDYYNLSPSQLTGKVRTAQIAYARHIAMYLIRITLDVSQKKIGDMFGGKDHTTVKSAIEKVDKELKTNEILRDAIEELKKRIKQ